MQTQTPEVLLCPVQHCPCAGAGSPVLMQHVAFGVEAHLQWRLPQQGTLSQSPVTSAHATDWQVKSENWQLSPLVVQLAFAQQCWLVPPHGSHAPCQQTSP